MPAQTTFFLDEVPEAFKLEPVTIPLQPTATAACANCGRHTTAPQLLARDIRSFRIGSSAAQLTCPRCLTERRRRFNVLNQYCIAAGVVATLLFLWFGGGKADERWIASASLIAMCTFPPAILLHELAHAVVAKLVGFRVFGITIGTGQRLLRRRVGRCVWEWRFWPIAGICWTLPQRDESPRLKWAAVLLAGPLVHLSVVLAIYLACDIDLHRSDWPLGEWPTGLLIANAYLLIVSLAPVDLPNGDQMMQSDGKQLLALFRRCQDSFAITAARAGMEMKQALDAGELGLARRSYERLLHSASDAVTVVCSNYPCSPQKAIGPELYIAPNPPALFTPNLLPARQ